MGGCRVELRRQDRHAGWGFPDETDDDGAGPGDGGGGHANHPPRQDTARKWASFGVTTASPHNHLISSHSRSTVRRRARSGAHCRHPVHPGRRKIGRRLIASPCVGPEPARLWHGKVCSLPAGRPMVAHDVQMCGPSACHHRPVQDRTHPPPVGQDLPQTETPTVMSKSTRHSLLLLTTRLVNPALHNPPRGSVTAGRLVYCGRPSPALSA